MFSTSKLLAIHKSFSGKACLITRGIQRVPMNRHESPNKYPLRTCLYYKKNDLGECLIILLLSYFYILVTMVFTMVFTGFTMVLPWLVLPWRITKDQPQDMSSTSPGVKPRWPLDGATSARRRGRRSATGSAAGNGVQRLEHRLLTRKKPWIWHV